MRFLLQYFYDKLKVKLSSLDTEITNIQNGNISIDWSKITNAPTKLSTYSNATTSAAGLMSASDKSNLDTVVSKVNNISSGANKVAWKQNVTSGTQIATITIDGTSTAVYAPAATAGTTYSGSSAGSNATPDTTSNGAITVSGTTISTTATADCAIPTATITSLCSSILS